MAFRNDVIVYWAKSPRVIEVQAPSTQISLQDLVDTCRELEQRSENMQYSHLLNAAGKEALGGGVLVGITVELQNAVVAFQPRSGSKTTGTITTLNVAGEVLEDTGATFISDGVVPGDTIQNVTDNSFSSVVSVDSEIQLTCYPLSDGSDNQFQISDSYQVIGKEQCEIAGGNLVAVDDNDLQISAILPTRNTHVVRTSSSSATLQEQADIQFSSFVGGVSIDVTTPHTGTAFPVGTPRAPVNNLTDALAIAEARGLTNIFIAGAITVDSGLDFTAGYKFMGVNPIAMATVASAAQVDNCEFVDLQLDGTLDNDARVTRCLIGDLLYFNGFIENCFLAGDITLGGGAAANFVDCADFDPTAGSPTIDMGGSGQSLAIRGYYGAIEIINKNGSDDIAIDIQGRVILDSTVTAGNVRVRGIGQVVDNSTGTTVVNQDDLITRYSIADAVWDEPIADHQTAGTLGRIIKTILAKINAILGLS